MSKVFRNDIFVRSEKGGAWFEDFLQSFAEAKAYSLQDMLDTINQKRSDSVTVKSVVDQYKEMVGLDSIAGKTDNIAETSTTSNPIRPLSIRHAKELKEEEPKHIILLIEQDPGLSADLHSLCRHSGGTKNTHSIMNFLREQLGNELVSYNDDKLIQYIDDVKKQYYHDTPEPDGEVGKIGLDDLDNPEDDVADFIEHGKR